MNFVVFIYWTVTKKSTKLSYSLEKSCAANPELTNLFKYALGTTEKIY